MDEGDRLHCRRIIEALIFAAAGPLDEASLAERLPSGVAVRPLVEELMGEYRGRGVNLIEVAGRWTFRTAPDLAFLLRRDTEETRRLSRAAIETLAIVAYHQPVTRAEIEAIRGVAVSKGTLDVLLETAWVKPAGRRKTPGKPLTFKTTDIFLEHFGLAQIGDLPGIEDLKAAGLVDPRQAMPVIGRDEELEPLEDGDDGMSEQAEALDMDHPSPEDDKSS
ncbi:MAG: SMC-Scp complex subunit ScpB [Zavarzinia sp.]|nr:SMC-Scp complex subunit ScpB [Zavarzinia sp.]